MKRIISKIAWFFCRLFYRFYGILISAIYAVMLFKNVPVTILAMATGIAVDGWRYHQFLELPADRQIRKLGFVAAFGIAGIVASVLAMQPQLFGHFIEYSYHNYQMVVKLTLNEEKARWILLVENFVIVSAFIFSQVQLIAFERGNYRHTEKMKVKGDENKVILLFLLFVFVYFAPSLAVFAFAIREPSRLGPGLYVPHINMLLLLKFAFYLYGLTYVIRFLLSTYRIINDELSSKSGRILELK